MPSAKEERFFGVISKIDSHPRATYRFVVNTRRLQAMRARAVQCRTSLFTVLVNGLHLLVYKLTGSTDSVIGANTIMRGHEDLSRMIGFMVNTVLIRNQVHPEVSFLEKSGPDQKKPLRSYCPDDVSL
jgi:hypothetical protein